MSTLAAWSYVEGPCTIWPKDAGELDEWGQPVGGAPYLIPAIDYEFGGDVARDANGTEFVPRITVYMEAEIGSNLVPEQEWYLKLGNHLNMASPPADAERIRVVTMWPMDKFGAGEIPDWRLLT